MTWRMKTEEVLPPVPDGEYAAMPVNIQEMNGPHGPMVRIDFQIADDDQWEGRRLSGIASKKLSANTKLGSWVAAIMGGMPHVGREVTEDDLLHHDCVVVVRQVAGDQDRVYANVIDVRNFEQN